VATLFLLLASWLLLRGLRDGRARDFALGGACVALSAMDYYSGRITPVLALVLAALWLWQRQRYPQMRFRLWWIGLGASLVGSVRTLPTCWTSSAASAGGAIT
jgi:hypothetical protein